MYKNRREARRGSRQPELLLLITAHLEFRRLHLLDPADVELVSVVLESVAAVLATSSE